MGRTKPDLHENIIAAHKALEDKINYQFIDKALLIEAMTHPSILAGKTNKTSPGSNNQRLEFLGDRVINLIIADAIFTQMINEREGVLTRLYHDCVDNVTMAELARQLSLGNALLVQENTDLANTDKVLADALEALIGAIWRDGGYSEASRVVLSIWQKKLTSGFKVEKDAKSRLQEYALKHFAVLPEYEVIHITGPSHQPEFTVAVNLDDLSSDAIGSSRRQAEQNAADAWLNEHAKTSSSKISSSKKEQNS